MATKYKDLEQQGLVARYGPGREDVIFPDTRVWYPDGVPADLPLKAGVDVKKALRLVADCIRDGQAMPVGPDTFPSRGFVISANWLAYWAPVTASSGE